MADTPRDSEAPAANPALSGAVLAAGAGVLAGLVLGRRAVAGVAAGVAAAASVKLLSGGHAPADSASRVSVRSPRPQPPFPPAPSLFPSMAAEKISAPGDWVDHDAVVYSHIVPDTAKAGEMLKEKALPLLDDEGLPVEHVTVQPIYPEDLSENYHFPLGPIIWEPGRFVQSHSDGLGETVWFGLQDFVQEQEQPEEIVVESLPVPPPSEAMVEESAFEILPEETPFTPTIILPPASADTSFMAELSDALSPSSMTLEPEDAVASNDEKELPPLPEIIITAKSTGKTVLPQPRHQRTPIVPVSEQAPVPSLDEEQAKDVQSLLKKILPESGSVRVGEHSRPRHHLEPVAPTRDTQEGEKWPLVLILCALIIAGLFFAVGWLDDGTFFRRSEKVPWLRQKAPETEQTTSAVR